MQKYVLHHEGPAEHGAAVLTAPQSKKVYQSFPGTELEPLLCCLSRFIIYILRNHFFFLHLCSPARRMVHFLMIINLLKLNDKRVHV